MTYIEVVFEGGGDVERETTYAECQIDGESINAPISLSVDSSAGIVKNTIMIDGKVYTIKAGSKLVFTTD